MKQNDCTMVNRKKHCKHVITLSHVFRYMYVDIRVHSCPCYMESQKTATDAICTGWGKNKRSLKRVQLNMLNWPRHSLSGNIKLPLLISKGTLTKLVKLQFWPDGNHADPQIPGHIQGRTYPHCQKSRRCTRTERSNCLAIQSSDCIISGY